MWERAVKESEEELVSSESGVSGMLRRAFRPFAALGNGTPGGKPDKQGGASYEETTSQSTPD